MFKDGTISIKVDLSSDSWDCKTTTTTVSIDSDIIVEVDGYVGRGF